MLRLISDKRTETILRQKEPVIAALSAKYSVPAAFIKAILYMEMTRIDIMDTVADAVVLSNLFSKKDSSTGYAQIFGRVALNAVNSALDHGISDFLYIKLDTAHRLDPDNPADVRAVWKYLRHNINANIEAGVLNMLSAAEEMTGRIDFSSYSEEELKLILTRYNANTHKITKYGEEAYSHYLRYLNK